MIWGKGKLQNISSQKRSREEWSWYASVVAVLEAQAECIYEHGRHKARVVDTKQG